MNDTIKTRLLQLNTVLQRDLLAGQEVEQLDITPKLQEIITVLELIQIEHNVLDYRVCVGRPNKYHPEIARAFVAPKMLNRPTTEARIDRLKVDITLRRICGFEKSKEIPGAWTFSRAYAEFSALGLPAIAHEALIKHELGGQLMGHIKYDDTAIEAREKVVQQSPVEEKPKYPRGRPRPDEKPPTKELTILEKQQQQSLNEMLFKR